MGKFLIDEAPQMYQPTLARIIGLNEAIFVQQLKYWLNMSKNTHDGRRWVYNSQDDWLKQFPFWSKRTLQRILTNLMEQGIIICANLNKSKFDKTNWYSLDEERLGQIVDDFLSAEREKAPEDDKKRAIDNAKMASSDNAKMASSDDAKLATPIPENTIDNQEIRYDAREMAQSDDFSKVAKAYSDNIHPLSGSIEADKLGELIDRYGGDLVIKAIERAVNYNARTLAYISRVLDNWHDHGFKEPKAKTAGGPKPQGDMSRIPEWLRRL